MTGFSKNGLIVIVVLDQAWKIEVMTKTCSNGVTWHNDALVDVDWIVDVVDQSIIRKLTVDCSTDIVKQSQVGARKGEVLQPRDVFCGLKKFEMPHFIILKRRIDPMQRL